jgi:hypothetical protein
MMLQLEYFLSILSLLSPIGLDVHFIADTNMVLWQN